jgi:hypothetical protein
VVRSPRTYVNHSPRRLAAYSRRTASGSEMGVRTARGYAVDTEFPERFSDVGFGLQEVLPGPRRPFLRARGPLSR